MIKITSNVYIQGVKKYTTVNNVYSNLSWKLQKLKKQNKQKKPACFITSRKDISGITPLSTVFFTSMENFPVLRFTIAFRS